MDNIKNLEIKNLEDIVVRDAATRKILMKYEASENEFSARVKIENYGDKNEK